MRWAGCVRLWRVQKGKSMRNAQKLFHVKRSRTGRSCSSGERYFAEIASNGRSVFAPPNTCCTSMTLAAQKGMIAPLTDDKPPATGTAPTNGTCPELSNFCPPESGGPSSD